MTESWRQSDEAIRMMIAKEIWHYQECEESYGPFDQVTAYDEGMGSLIKQTAIDQAECIRKVILESSVLKALFEHKSRPAQRRGFMNLRHYVAMRQAQPLKGLGDSVHSIHAGTEYEAELKFTDLEEIAALAPQPALDPATVEAKKVKHLQAYILHNYVNAARGGKYADNFERDLGSMFRALLASPAPKSPALDPATVEACAKTVNNLRQDEARDLNERYMGQRGQDRSDALAAAHKVIRALASPAPSGEPSHSQISQLDDASNASAVPCKNCDGTKRALYFSEQNWSHEIRACHLCAAPACNAVAVMRRALEEIQDLGDDGCTAARLGNIAHAALIEAGPDSSTGQTGNDLASLRQAIIDHTHGDLFWIGEILLGELEKETGFTGAAFQTSQSGGE